jgi:hypothetical protein
MQTCLITTVIATVDLTLYLSSVSIFDYLHTWTYGFTPAPVAVWNVSCVSRGL